MSPRAAQSSSALPNPETGAKEVNIINRREIMPLLSRAWQVLTYYDKATDCSAAVLDKSGKTVKSLDAEKQMQYCAFCKKHFHNTPPIWQGIESSCEKIHLAALGESRRIEGVYIYACELGFIYWTSPLYRNGRYAGALTAGQVIFQNGQNRIVEKFHSLCKDKIVLQKFSKMIEEISQKNHEEIQAMACLLGVCTEEISERGEESGEMIRRLAWQKMNSKNSKEPQKAQAKKSQPGRSPAALPGNSGPETDGPEALNNQDYPLEKERMLLAAFRRGDNETGGKILKELMDCIIQAIPDLEIIRFRAMELVVLLSRAAIPESLNDPASGNMLETNNRYLRRIQESKTKEELVENLHIIAERMAGRIFSFQGIRHASVLRKAERYIWENYTRKLSLDEIARASGLSAPYFSTIFKEEMGENLSSYLNRLRVEKAATLLMETGKSLSEIAGLCGFEDQSWFSKIFKSFTAVSPGKYREYGGSIPKQKPGKKRGKEEKVFSAWNKLDMLSS